MDTESVPHTIEIDDRVQSDVKLILLGDSAVGKSKLVERYLQGNYNTQQVSADTLLFI